LANIDRGVYSILGLAAVNASVTRTISVAMIVLELTGHLSYSVPLMVCVLFSYGTSEIIKPESFFEMLAEVGGLLELHSKKGKIMIKDILVKEPWMKEVDFLSIAESTRDDILYIVKEHTKKDKLNKMRYIPVVDNNIDRNLLYMVKLPELRQWCQFYYGSNDYAPVETLP
jgi:hypothetical protein